MKYTHSQYKQSHHTQVLDDCSKSNTSHNSDEAINACKPLTLKDLFAGLAQLATSGVLESTEVIESIHREVLLRPLGRYNEVNKQRWSKGLTAKAYQAMRGMTKRVGYRLAVPTVSRYPDSDNPTPLSPTLKQLVNVMNGVIGDHLAEHHNALAVAMCLYDRYGQPLSLPSTHNTVPTASLSGRVVILAHGLCMSYLSWRLCEPDGLGERIVATQPQTTILYLDYNSGLPVSQNGRALSRLLQNLIHKHPNISHIDLVGHSMGGLVIRSAIFYADKVCQHQPSGSDEKSEKPNAIWVDKLDKIITLGTPHNGAILERIGYFIQDVSTKIPFASAISSLVNIRSKGINDLRYGSICDDTPMKGIDGIEKPPSMPHTSIAIPNHVTLYCIAGTLVEGIHDSTASQLLGDGLVVVDSAFGEYVEHEPLNILENHKAVFYGVSHYYLIYNASVHKQIIAWLNEDKQTKQEEQHKPATRLHVYQNTLKVEM